MSKRLVAFPTTTGRLLFPPFEVGSLVVDRAVAKDVREPALMRVCTRVVREDAAGIERGYYVRALKGDGDVGRDTFWVGEDEVRRAGG